MFKAMAQSGFRHMLLTILLLVWSLLSYSVSANSLTSNAVNTDDVHRNLVDPTRPPGAKAIRAGTVSGKSGKPAWSLTSILIANDRRLVRINGKLLGIGQSVNGATVIAIMPTEVWLKSNQKRFKISLLGVNIKKFSRIADK